MSKNFQEIVVIKDQVKGQVEEASGKRKETAVEVLEGEGIKV